MVELIDVVRPDTRDPVCGMEVTEETEHRASFGGHEYRFCSAECLERFRRAPAEFANASQGE